MSEEPEFRYPYPRKAKQQVVGSSWWRTYAGIVVFATVLIIALGFSRPSLSYPLYLALMWSGGIGLFLTPIMASVSEQSAASKLVQGFLLTSFQVIIGFWAFIGMMI